MLISAVVLVCIHPQSLVPSEKECEGNHARALVRAKEMRVLLGDFEKAANGNYANKDVMACKLWIRYWERETARWWAAWWVAHNQYVPHGERTKWLLEYWKLSAENR